MLRKLLYVALGALMLALALEAERSLRSGTSESGPARGLDILVFSSGADLEPPIYLEDRRAPEAAIFVGDQSAVPEVHEHGMLVATFDTDLGLLESATFNLEKQDQLTAFVNRCRLRDDVRLVVIATKGSTFVPPDRAVQYEGEDLHAYAVTTNYLDPGQPAYRSRLRTGGWYGMERSAGGSHRAWTHGTRSELDIEIDAPGPGTLYIRCSALQDDGGPRTLEVSVGGLSLGTVEVPGRLGALSWEVPAGILDHGLNPVVLDTDRAVRPSLHGSRDGRSLGVMIDYILFVPDGSGAAPPAKDPYDVGPEVMLDRATRLELGFGDVALSEIAMNWREHGSQTDTDIVLTLEDAETRSPVHEVRFPAADEHGENKLQLPRGLPETVLLRVELKARDDSPPTGTVVVDSLSVRRDLAGRAERAFTALGARARPFVERSASWAMIALRRGDRWVNLAEAYSIDQGVTLAFTIGPTLDAYDSHDTEYVVFSMSEHGPFVDTELPGGGLSSPFNGQSLEPAPLPDDLVFLAAGHLYGAPENQGAVQVPDRLLDTLDNLNDQGADLFMALGDVVRSPTPDRLQLLSSSFAGALEMPFFNAVGNHDVGESTARDIYEEEYGKTFYHFLHKGNAFIVVDTEVDHGEIIGEQLQRLRAALDRARQDRRVRRVIVCSHKLLWSVNRPQFDVVFKHLNSPSGYSTTDNYVTDVLPLLRTVASVKPVYWLSGDIGCSWSLPAFYGSEPSSDITYIAVGIGDTPRDGVLRCLIPRDGRASFDLLPLSGGDPRPVAGYDMEHWIAHFQR